MNIFALSRNAFKNTIYTSIIKQTSFSTRRTFSSLANQNQCRLCGSKLNTGARNVFRIKSIRFKGTSTKVEDGNTKEKLTRLLSLAHPERWRIGGAVGLLLISSAVSISVPFFIGKLMDIIFSDPQSNEEMLKRLKEMCFLLGFVFAAGAVANTGRIYMMQTSGQRIVQRLRSNAFRSVISQEVAFFDKEKSGELINRLATDTSLVSRAITDNISDGLRATAQAIGGVSLMVYTSPKLAGISLAVVPPIVLFAVLYGRYVRKITKNVQDKLAESSSVAEEKFANIRTVRAFGQESKEMNLYNAVVTDIYDLARKEAIARSLFYGYNGFTGNMIAMMVLYSGGCMMIDSQITVGDLTSFMLYTVYVGVSIAGLGSFYTELMRGLGASSRLWQLVDKKPTIPLAGGSDIFRVIADNSIDFKAIDFHYSSRPDVQILDEFNMKVKSGDICAIVGESGSGKSTVGSLLLRYYDVNKGGIDVGGHDIRSFDPTSLRQYIGTVSQEPALFSMTICENISYGATHDVTTNDIIDAAKKANAYKFISDFPDGFDTLVGERGQMLSGGQRQRIAIARAIIKNPKILLLDEATSALDAESEHLVQDALQKLMHGRTTIIIAHRLSTIKSANQIAVLQKGRIAEIGSYYDLLTKEDGLFKQLVDRQNFQVEE